MSGNRKLYTRQGDNGTSSTIDRKQIPKSDPVFDLLGTIDELNAHIGLAKLYVCRDIKEKLEAIQKDIFSVGGEIAGQPSIEYSRQISLLEEWIDEASQFLPQTNCFALPGKTIGGAHLDIARTAARKFERVLVRHQKELTLSAAMLVWANRLSDALFAFAETENHRQ